MTTPYNSFEYSIGLAEHNFNTDSIVAVLTNRQPLAGDTFADITPIATGNGYGPITVNVTWSQVGNGAALTCDDDTVTINATGAVPEFAHIVFYNSTSSELIGWESRTPIILADGDSVTIDLPSILYSSEQKV